MESIWLKYLVPAVTLITAAALCVSVVLLVIDLWRPRLSLADQGRANTAKLLMEALEKYHSAKGTYPLLSDKPITDLKSTLVDGGFLKVIPPDLTDASPMRYFSDSGTSYGILSTKDRRLCRIEVGASNTRWWGANAENLCSYD